MRYALMNGKKQEATQTGERATCQCCGNRMDAICGDKMINHWRHFSKVNCDSWYSPITQWHIDWQNHFPKEWQEVWRTDEKGERHAADILTLSGVVIEFQHSPISGSEINSRETYYNSVGNLIWVLDADNLKVRVELKKKKITFTQKKYEIQVLNFYNPKYVGWSFDSFDEMCRHLSKLKEYLYLGSSFRIESFERIQEKDVTEYMVSRLNKNFKSNIFLDFPSKPELGLFWVQKKKYIAKEKFIKKYSLKKGKNEST